MRSKNTSKTKRKQRHHLMCKSESDGTQETQEKATGRVLLHQQHQQHQWTHTALCCKADIQQKFTTKIRIKTKAAEKKERRDEKRNIDLPTEEVKTTKDAEARRQRAGSEARRAHGYRAEVPTECRPEEER